MTDSPRIGVSACFLYPDPQRAVFGPKTLASMESDMARALVELGVMPVLIPDIPAPRWEEMLGSLDGFVLQGGSDIAPATYGATALNAGRWPGDPPRDAFEMRLVDYAFNHDKPVLGICRGCQLLNVYFGGTLYQDLPSEKGATIVHRDALLYDRVRHQADILPGGLLAQIYPGRERVTVNSVHHQAIRDVATGLRVEAVSSEDGVVEGVSYAGEEPCPQPGSKFLLGVQWHPEFSRTLGALILPPEPLFERFLTESRKRRDKR